jgi:hypothetical protein
MYVCVLPQTDVLIYMQLMTDSRVIASLLFKLYSSRLG